jgi:ribosomal protein L37AE/L43A
MEQEEDYIILFNGKEYYISNKYIFNKKTNQIFSLYWNKYLNPFLSNKCAQTYVSLNSTLFNYIKVIKWNQDPTIDRSKLTIVERVHKKCRICKREDVKFSSKKMLVCNNCIVNYKSKAIKEKILNDNYITVDKFLHKLKAKKWMATDIDLFELINVYELYFPNMQLGPPLTESGASKILLRIAKHHVKLKSQAIKEWIKD